MTVEHAAAASERPLDASVEGASGVAARGFPEHAARAIRGIQRIRWHDFATAKPPSIKAITGGYLE
jgi:hypothetical protein